VQDLAQGEPEPGQLRNDPHLEATRLNLAWLFVHGTTGGPPCATSTRKLASRLMATWVLEGGQHWPCSLRLYDTPEPTLRELQPAGFLIAPRALSKLRWAWWLNVPAIRPRGSWTLPGFCGASDPALDPASRGEWIRLPTARCLDVTDGPLGCDPTPEQATPRSRSIPIPDSDFAAGWFLFDPVLSGLAMAGRSRSPRLPSHQPRPRWVDHASTFFDPLAAAQQRYVFL